MHKKQQINFLNERTFLMQKPEVIIQSQQNDKKETYDLIWYTCFSILSNVGQGFFLPLFISTFAKSTCVNGIATGSYFILFIMSFLLNFSFFIGCVKDYCNNTLNLEYAKPFITQIVFMGIFDAMNGILMVYSSTLNRTSGYMQSILINLNIPLTIIISRILFRNENTLSLKSGCFILIGIIISILPSIINLTKSKNNLNLSDFFFHVCLHCQFCQMSS